MKKYADRFYREKMSDESRRPIEELIANYIKQTGCSIDDISLVENRSNILSTSYSISNKTKEPWPQIKTLEYELEAARKIAAQYRNDYVSCMKSDYCSSQAERENIESDNELPWESND